MVHIRDIIILEGPDGSGKTTLKDRLLLHFDLIERPRACTSEGGPVDELMQWLQTDLKHLSQNQYNFDPAYLYDRYPPFSEMAYGPSCRSSLNPGFDQPHVFAAQWTALSKLRPTVIWCMPPKHVVVENVMNEATPHMSGVIENIRTIYATYQVIQSMWHAIGGYSMVWDYTAGGWDEWSQDFYENTDVNYRKDI